MSGVLYHADVEFFLWLIEVLFNEVLERRWTITWIFDQRFPDSSVLVSSDSEYPCVRLGVYWGLDISLWLGNEVDIRRSGILLSYFLQCNAYFALFIELSNVRFCFLPRWIVEKFPFCFSEFGNSTICIGCGGFDFNDKWLLSGT
ncbi:hypothetical protein DVK01_18160 [Haloarcula sp. Atlit-120R]|nr:hypothetical protein DVK01_18160 [Haloarcula sp. Atlit-120R]